MARKSHADDGNRRHSMFISRPELYEECTPDANPESPALRKRLSMYARKRTSIAWAPRHVDEMSPTLRSLSSTPSQSSFSTHAPEAGFRSSLRRTSRIVSSSNLHIAPESLTRWIHGTEKAAEEQRSAPLKSRRSTMTISQPFDFQHVSHTSAHKLPKLQDVGTNIFAEEVLSASAQADPPAIQTRATAPPAASDAKPSRVRSASIASIISNKQRAAPTMVHPALRNDGDSANAELASQAWLAPFIHRSDSGATPVKNLAVVPEEHEPESPTKEGGVMPALEQETASLSSGSQPASTEGVYPVELPADGCPAIETAEEGASEKSFLRLSAGNSEVYDLRRRKSSVPSLTSAAESWEEDIDYCYSVEAESSCNFEWSHAKINSNSPRDSLMPSQSSRLHAEMDRINESPRVSIARQQEKLRKWQGTPSSEWQSEEIYREFHNAPSTPARTSLEWPLINTSPASYEPTADPHMSSISTESMSTSSNSYELRRSDSQSWVQPVTSRWRIRDQGLPVQHDMSAPVSPSRLSVPPPSVALPQLPQKSSSNAPSNLPVWI